MNFAGYRPPLVLLCWRFLQHMEYPSAIKHGWVNDEREVSMGKSRDLFRCALFIYLFIYIYIMYIHIYLYPFAYIYVYLSSLFASYIFGFPGLAGHSTIAGLAIGAPRAAHRWPRINYLCKQAVCGRSADPAVTRPWWLGPGGPQSLWLRGSNHINVGKFDHGLTVLPKPAIMVSKGNFPREALFQVN